MVEESTGSPDSPLAGATEVAASEPPEAGVAGAGTDGAALFGVTGATGATGVAGAGFGIGTGSGAVSTYVGGAAAGADTPSARSGEAENNAGSRTSENT